MIKKNIIKQNTKNIVECLKEKDLWKNKDIQDENFETELLEIKSLNIKIYEILWFYLYLTNNKEEEFEKEAEEHSKNKKKLENPKPRWDVKKQEKDCQFAQYLRPDFRFAVSNREFYGTIK